MAPQLIQAGDKRIEAEFDLIPHPQLASWQFGRQALTGNALTRSALA
jgi:hypothetical protein